MCVCLRAPLWDSSNFSRAFLVKLESRSGCDPWRLQVVAANVRRFTEEGAVGGDELARAKTQLKASLMQQLSTFSFVAEDIGRQILTYGRRVPPVETFARIDAVTLNDIRSTAQRRFSGKSVAVAALGKIDKLPDYKWINGLLK